jgi:enediyne biosynthesis protein E4
MKQVLTMWVAAIVAGLLMNCSGDSDKKFRLVPAAESGIEFSNTLKESVEFNIFNYMYFYNGGGVAVGDVNGDELPDIYFTANQAPNKLYINRAGLRFKDVTSDAGVEGFNGWTTGVTMADVNSDGKLDIYVSYLGDYLIYRGKNQLFINEGNDENGVPIFVDRAMEFGLDLVGFSTQASFFDYDRDGDLDMFMLNHSLHENGTFGKSTLRNDAHPLAGDRLLRNDNGRYVDVTQGSGIYNSVIGYGLGVVVSDVNLDGWPDLYVGNDFHENDYLYINQKDGTFKENLQQAMTHTSRYTMGVDFADMNNDAFPDLIAMDMLPDDPVMLKASAAEDAYDVYNFKLNYGYNHQFARNTLQLNNHDGTFSEIGLMAGVAATDWSWSSLFADFDLDGHKDLFVSNGILRRSNDLDYINFISVDSVQMRMKYQMSQRQLAYIEKMPKIKVPNYLFINDRDSSFTNVAMDWGLDQPSYSNGTAYSDLDNDGDLDIVVNNVDDKAFIYENRTIDLREKDNKHVNHYLQITLKGKPGNLAGIGAKVFLYDSGTLQMQECMPTRGYQSSVDPRLLFGTANQTQIDSVIVVWTDGVFQTLKDVNTDQKLVVDQTQAAGDFDYSIFHPAASTFTQSTEALDIPYKHKENRFIEFNREALIPHMLSAEGPAVAIADIDNDGREDLFVGGAKWAESKLFIQTANGKFRESRQPALQLDSTFEDVDAVFFDADGDSDNDLFVVSGGNEFSGKSQYRNSRLYLNDGRGNFRRSPGIPPIFTTGSVVAVYDVDADGDTDIFLGSRAVPWRYGIKPDSYILLNDGHGTFTDATDTVAPGLRHFGFVKKAVWADMDGDAQKDLVIAAEWSPVTILFNTNGKLKAQSLEGSGLDGTEGWWNTIEPADIDNDGDLDLIAGNLGLNSKLKATPAQPVKLFVGDFDKNDSTDQLLTHFVGDKEYPFNTRDEMTKQMPYLKKRYLSYQKFANTSFHEMFSAELLVGAEHHTANTFQSCIVENIGDKKFKMRPLPRAAQLSTINAILSDDFDGNGTADLLVAGNFYPINIQMGRNDASYGVFLQGNGKGAFKAVPQSVSGFKITGEVRHLKKITAGRQVYYLAIRNNDTIEAFKVKK